MKIAIVGENYYPTVGGIQEHILHQARVLRNRGHEVYVVTGMPSVPVWAGPEDDEFVIRIGRSVRYGVMGTYTRATLDPMSAIRLRRLFAEKNFDLVHIHGPFDVGLPMLVPHLFRGPKVATMHSAFHHSPGRTLMIPWIRHILGKMDRVIAVSPLAAKTILRYASFEHTIIPNGVDVGTFSAGKRLSLYDDGRKNIVYLGRIEPRNGLDLLFEALPTIAEAFPDVRLIVAGDGPQRSAYEAILSPQMRQHVEFLGLIQNELRPDLYATGHCFALPARFGGSFSIMVLEALAAGAPIVSTPFVAEELRDSHWDPVYLTKDYTPAAIATGIIEVLQEDPKARVSHGLDVVQEYDWERIGEKIEAVYTKLLESHRDEAIG